MVSSGFAFGQKVVNIEAPGNLASQRSTPLNSLSEAASTDTPVDFFDLSTKKIQEENYDEAAMAFVVGTVYGTYDMRRVEDKTAHQGVEVLIMQKMGDVSPEQKAKLQEAVSKMITQPSGLVDTLKKLGKPSYHPTYMIQHGMGAFSPEKPKNGGIVEGFDGDVEWSKLLQEAGNP